MKHLIAVSVIAVRKYESVMKKTIYFAAAALSLMSLAACSGNNKCGDANVADKPDETFTGLVPAADGPGIRYTLKLDYDDDKANKAGDYDLVETYVEADSVMKNGYRDDVSYKSEGDFTVIEQNGRNYLKLVKDAKDSNPQASSDLYFLVDSDSTLTMVNSRLEPAVADSLNYTLRLVK